VEQRAYEEGAEPAPLECVRGGCDAERSQQDRRRAEAVVPRQRAAMTCECSDGCVRISFTPSAPSSTRRISRLRAVTSALSGCAL
jgi:hypothetical protein